MSEAGTTAPAARPGADASIRVLLVDDDPGVADVAARFLERSDEPLEVTVEHDAAAGLERLETDEFDCVVSDYQMPGMNGVEFLRAVRADRPDLPFVLFTGKGSEEIASEAISAGVTDYLQKGTGTDQYGILARQVTNAVTRRRAEIRVEQHLDAAPDGVVIVGPNGGIRRVNDRLTEQFGYEADELLGERVEVLLPERFREDHVAYREAYTESPERRPMGAGRNLYGQRRDGTEFPVDVSLSPLALDGHTEVIATVRDATERQRHEAEIEELNRINRTLRETTAAAVRAGTRTELEQVICETLADSEPYLFAWVGRVDGETVSPAAWAGIERGYLDSVAVTAAERETGLGPTGRAVRSREPRAMQNVHEDPDYEPWREAARERGYESSAAIPLTYQDTLYGVLNVYAERPGAFDERELSVLGELGTTVAHAISRLELTDQFREQYRDLFEEAPVMAVLTRNEDGTPVVDACNELFLERLGYEREDALGEPLAAFYSADSTTALLEHGGYDRALSDRFTREERTLVTADGEHVEALLRAVPRRDDAGEVVGSLALYVDISERKQLEREVERLDAFTSVVSHDLRNPLNVIQGSVDLALENHEGDENLQRIADAADRMQRLIEDLLTLARQGETVGETRTVDLGRTARRAWENVGTGDATLRVEDGTPGVTADPDRLMQLLENLYRNAVEHAGPDATVTLGPLTTGSGFYVADDGPGIPPDERERVFEWGHSTKSDGTGFGLPIVRGIAEAHGWTISVTESEAGGARFEVRGVETKR